nr:MAG TPA: hypothetical protein [Caudoviricetes sp.]DAY45547.1 MAG TPA: hypothetical protein [Caudoviricetes sp.]
MYLKRLKILPKNVHFLLNPGLGFKGFRQFLAKDLGKILRI